MSESLRIMTNKKIDMKKTISSLFDDYKNIVIEENDNNIFYYLYGNSTRGVDVTIEKDFINIRNRVLSNRADYFLSGKLTYYLASLTESKIIDEGDNIILLENLKTTDEGEKTFFRDVDSVSILLKNDTEIIEFPGPTRSVFIGKDVYNKYKDENGNLDPEKVQELFLTILYGLPDFLNSPSLGADSNEANGKIIKLKMILPNYDLIIQDYDYIVVGKEDSILLDINGIKSILPDSWVIVDEYTIVAPQLEAKEWNKFLEKSKKINCYDEFTKRTKSKNST